MLNLSLFRSKAFLFLGLTLIVFLIVFILKPLFSPSSPPSSNHQTSSSSLKIDQNLTTLLFLGIGGQGHQAPDLTDSILFAAFNHQTQHLVTISLPRDLWSDTYQAKINTFYHYSLEQSPQDPLTSTKAMMSQIVGLPIHYLVILDFNGFVKLIDLVGGVDINVERAFDDYKYPIPGKETAQPESARYEHLHFDAGWQHMDGQRALKFARSRHALGEEGSDFARSRRQQQVIRAFLQKVFSSQTLLNPKTLLQLKNQLADSLITDISPREIPALLNLAFALKQHPDYLLSDSITSLLKEPASLQPYQGQWVLVPKYDWTTIHEYIQKAVNR